MTREEISKVREELIDSVKKAFDIAVEAVDKVISVNSNITTSDEEYGERLRRVHEEGAYDK